MAALLTIFSKLDDIDYHANPHCNGHVNLKTRNRNFPLKTLTKFTKRQFNKLIKHIEKFQKKRNTETLHQIRIDIKKIKAVLTGIGATDNDFKTHKHFIPLRLIFRRTGQIREPAILTSILKNQDEPNVDMNKVAEFESDTPEFIKTVKKQLKKLKKPLSGVRKRDLNKYVHKNKRKIKSLLFPLIVLDKIHKTRKAIKDVLYLSEAGVNLTKREFDFFDTLQNLIGKLHDNQVLLTYLQTSKKNEKERKNVITSECTEHISAITKMVHEFY